MGFESELPRASLQAFYDLHVGESVGFGMARNVFESKLNPSIVIKVENGKGSFQNIVEFETWNNVREYGNAYFMKWFCPVLHISDCGRILVMAKAKKATRYPTNIPVFLTDTKKNNYGVHNGRFVCLDYGTNLLWRHGLSPKMQKADWWDDEL